ncbi:acyl-CoA thioesterase [Salinithrix halophila]|uniref:Acyl-CoA thioesterase n=1 Tax=Salinithrix halophila TaxID=1485204 RepID=A0ABV8JG07_9BACL
MIHKTTFRVRYKETDQMGLVHHSNYPVWFEVGRTEMIRELGLSYGELERQGILLPVVDLHCRFIASARYDDEVKILTRVGEVRGPKLVFQYDVQKADTKDLLARGKTTHLWVDTSMKRVSLKETHPKVYQKLSAVVVRPGDEGE